MAELIVDHDRALTMNLVESLSNAIRVGMDPFDSASLAGVTKRRLKRWLEIGSRELMRVEELEENGKFAEIKQSLKLYVYLVQQVEKSLAEFQASSLTRIVRAATGTDARFDDEGNMLRRERGANWGADAWLLERRFPDKWGKNVGNGKPSTEDAPSIGEGANLKKLRDASKELEEWERKMDTKIEEADYREVEENEAI